MPVVGQFIGGGGVHAGMSSFINPAITFEYANIDPEYDLGK